MGSGTYRFGRFVLDVTDRSLVRDGVRVEINPRYLDALVLLVTEQGRLVSKDRFMDEVWRGVPVTDEALTQCIRTLRRQLGDSATRPEFIETVVKHGYRFVAPVEVAGGEVRTANSVDQISSKREQRILSLGGAGTVGALAAGLLGGMVYGFVAAATPLAAGTGAASVVLVIIVLTLIVAALGGAGVAFAVAAAVTYAPERTAWRIAAGMMGA